MSPFTAAHCISYEKNQLFHEKCFEVAVGKYCQKVDSIKDNEAQFSEVNVRKTTIAKSTNIKIRFTKFISFKNTKVQFKIM